MSGFDDQYQQMIDEYGWAIVGVFPTETAPGPNFAYTLGLTDVGLPEIFISGLPPKLAQQLLNIVASRIYEKAEALTPGQRIPDLLALHDAIIIEGQFTNDLYPGVAFRRYGRSRVRRLQQVVWPDKSGLFPWDHGYSLPKDAQPLLGRLRR